MDENWVCGSDTGVLLVSWGMRVAQVTQSHQAGATIASHADGAALPDLCMSDREPPGETPHPSSCAHALKRECKDTLFSPSCIRDLHNAGVAPRRSHSGYAGVTALTHAF